MTKATARPWQSPSSPTTSDELVQRKDLSADASHLVSDSAATYFKGWSLPEELAQTYKDALAAHGSRDKADLAAHGVPLPHAPSVTIIERDARRKQFGTTEVSLFGLPNGNKDR